MFLQGKATCSDYPTQDLTGGSEHLITDVLVTAWTSLRSAFKDVCAKMFQHYFFLSVLPLYDDELVMSAM